MDTSILEPSLIIMAVGMIVLFLFMGLLWAFIKAFTKIAGRKKQ